MNTQLQKFITGNEAVAEAAKAINFHFMGYYPITPSTEIAQLIDDMKIRGELDTVLLPADGEHGAAGACFGASTGGARVLNATSANGFLYSLEQLPVQAGSRLPMVLNLVTRSVSGPLDIRCDHSDLVFALQTGWIILLAANPQEVYDMNLFAVRLGEHPEVRLPVMVVSDGFFTSHHRQSVDIFSERTSAQKFIKQPEDLQKKFPTTLEPRKPITVGPYMNDADLINNKYQLHQAHNKAAEVFDQLCIEFEKMTGRKYSALETYQMQNAKSALFLLNSAAETSKDSIDKARTIGTEVGLLRPQILRPFPQLQLQKALEKLDTLVVGERSDSPGSSMGPIGHEVSTAILNASIEARKNIRLLHRVYGLGGKDFKETDADQFIQQSFDSKAEPFAFVGTFDGDRKALPPMVLPPLTASELSAGLTKVENKASKRKPELQVRTADLAQLSLRPKRIVAGHGACPGCGIFPALDQFFKGIEGDVVVLYHTGCAMVVTTDYPFSAHRVTYLHNLFQNGAPTMAGLVETYFEKRRRDEISESENITFVMVTGDGGMDIGMGPTIGTALRGHGMIVLEYDNQGYMNTGGQLSYTTPKGHKTSTSHVGLRSFGKSFHHKDTPAIMAATGIPYVFTAIESLNTDLVEKAAKAQWYAQQGHFVYGKLLTACPLNWASEEKEGQNILQMAVDTCFFPLYEIENQKTKLSYNPELQNNVKPISKWFEMMGKTRHLLKAENKAALEEIQDEITARWARLKARAEHPLL